MARPDLYPVPKYIAFFFTGLVIVIVTGLYGSGYIQFNNDASAAGDDVWGIPCPSWHPDACYIGSTDSMRMRFAVRMESLVNYQSDPLAVELLCFYAFGQDHVINFEWQTATEFDTAGFELHRSQAEQSGYVNISGFIDHCDTSGLVGGYYQFKDRSVTNGKRYYYKLVEIVSAQEKTEFGPISVIAGDAAVTNTPSRTLTPSSTPTVTRTPTPSLTPTLTRTPTPSNTTVPNEAVTLPPQQPGPSHTLTAINTESVITTSTPTGTRKTPSATVTLVENDTNSASFTPTILYTGGTGTPESAISKTFIAEAVESGTTVIVTPIGGRAGEQVTTPDLIDSNSWSSYPLALTEQSFESGENGYPFSMPTDTLFPQGYVSPPTRGISQLATMTPLSLTQVVLDSEPPQNSRIWLVAGFMASVLILAGGLYGIAKHWRRSSLDSETQGAPYQHQSVDGPDQTTSVE